MRLRKKLTTLTATLMILIGSLSACGALQIKTWFLDSKETGALIRKHANAPMEVLSYADADSYRCYSPIDDQAWRDRMALCCAGK